MLKGISIGLIATIFMDLLNVIFSKIGVLNAGNIKQIGLFPYAFLEKINLITISEAFTKSPALVPTGILLHIFIGIAYGYFFIILLNHFSKFVVSSNKEINFLNTFYLALGFGWFTTIAPFLIMQPTLGLGFFAMESQNAFKSIMTTLFNHSMFGVGLWIGVKVISKTSFFTTRKNQSKLRLFGAN